MPTRVPQAHSIELFGTDPVRLAHLRRSLIDHGGNRVEGFIDDAGGWPLRCCLTDSAAGDHLAIVAWCPFPWSGPFAELGPIVVHVDDCDGAPLPVVPPQFLSRRQVMRPYGFDRQILYDHIVLVEANGSLPHVISAALSRDDVDFVVVRNVLAGCYSFTVRRMPEATAGVASHERGPTSSTAPSGGSMSTPNVST
jgi:hypothetical protein